MSVTVPNLRPDTAKAMFSSITTVLLIDLMIAQNAETRDGEEFR